jgi:hypothetical protein
MQDMLSLYVIEDDLKVSVQPKQFQEPAELEYNLDRYLDTILSGYYQATKSSLAFRLTEDEGTYRPHKDKNFRIEMKFGAESLQRFSRLSTILAGTPRGFLLEYLQSNLSK